MANMLLHVTVYPWLSLLSCRTKSFSAFGPSSDCISERQLSVNLSVFQHQDTSCCLVTDFFRTVILQRKITVSTALKRAVKLILFTNFLPEWIRLDPGTQAY